MSDEGFREKLAAAKEKIHKWREERAEKAEEKEKRRKVISKAREIQETERVKRGQAAGYYSKSEAEKRTTRVKQAYVKREMPLKERIGFEVERFGTNAAQDINAGLHAAKSNARGRGGAMREPKRERQPRRPRQYRSQERENAAMFASDDQRTAIMLGMPEPPVRQRKNRIYRDDQMQGIGTIFGINPPRQKKRGKREPYNMWGVGGFF